MKKRDKATQTLTAYVNKVIDDLAHNDIENEDELQRYVHFEESKYDKGLYIALDYKAEKVGVYNSNVIAINKEIAERMFVENMPKIAQYLSNEEKKEYAETFVQKLAKLFSNKRVQLV